MTDPIADMLTRIRNAQAIHEAKVNVPHSKLKEALTKTLVSEGYLVSYELLPTEPHRTLCLTLKYANSIPAITVLKRISKPGRRLYARCDSLTSPLSGYGITVVSTSRGVMTDKQARKLKVGGELLCQIW
jgi:small subunit ribosomal protein S8